MLESPPPFMRPSGQGAWASFPRLHRALVASLALQPNEPLGKRRLARSEPDHGLAEGSDLDGHNRKPDLRVGRRVALARGGRCRSGPLIAMVRQAEVDAACRGSRARAGRSPLSGRARAAARKRAHELRAAFRRSLPSTLDDGSIYVVGTAKPLVRHCRGGGDPVESARGAIWAASRPLPAT
jgi:hypothetical protein